MGGGSKKIKTKPGRSKGRPKKKSIKVAIHSGMSTERKLSRFGKKRKKNLAGLDAVFIGRSAALRKLQLSLKDFRRLCILKGVYPRQPRGNKAPKNKKGQVFYHLKDLKALSHEPLLEKFREFKSFMKKVRKASARDEKDEAKKKYEKEVKYTLHHLVKERYPRFIDALEDLDDALTLVFLFAALPSTGRIKTKITRKAKDLACAWSAYCAMNHAVTKNFISIKGVYFEANIYNAKVRWIIPHNFTQYLPKEVDYRVMATFFEFYEVLIDFVLYKLYNDLGIKYPLSSVEHLVTLGSNSTLLSAYLQTLTKVFKNRTDSGVSDVVTDAIQEGTEKTPTSEKESSNESKSTNVLQASKDILAKINEEDIKDGELEKDNEDEEEENVDIATPLKAALESIAKEEEERNVFNKNESEEIKQNKNLFHGLTFFLSREVPRGYLEVIILSYGGDVGWEADDSPIHVKDKSITHHILDRPKGALSDKFYDNLPKNREFIQPQWIVDSANFLFRLPVGKYGIGKALPPHLSPWVNDEEEGYKPAYKEEIERLKEGKVVDTDIIERSPQENNIVSEDESQSEDENVCEENEDSHSDNEEEEKDNSEEEELEDEEEDDDDDDEKPNKHESMKAKDDEDAKELAKFMMSKKARRLYGRMQHGIEMKKQKCEELHKKRKEIDMQSKKTAMKQKVDRKKGERKSIENKYGDSGGSIKKAKRAKK